MRLYAPLDESNDVLRRDAALGENAVAARKSPAPAPAIVRSNIALEAANETALDISAIEQLAQRQRSVGIVRTVKALFAAIAAWYERNEYSERDEFFAASANLADLEQRQRYFERTGIAHY